MSSPELEMFEAYYGTINQKLDLLRAKCLGQMRPLHSLVPIAGKVSHQITAALVAEIRTILIYKNDHPDDDTLFFYKGWLEAVIVFVLGNCPKEDHTLFALVKLASLEGNLVLEIVDENLSRDARQLLLHPPQNHHAALEEAIWQLIEEQEKQHWLAFYTSGAS